MWENGGENLHLDLGSEMVNVHLENLKVTNILSRLLLVIFL